MAKKLVNSDFKHNRVEDPTQISSKQEKLVKKYMKDFFDKAVAKRRAHEKKKAERKDKEGATPQLPPQIPDQDDRTGHESDAGQEVDVSDNEMELNDPISSQPASPEGDFLNGDTLKRKREGDGREASTPLVDENSPSKRVKSATPPPPPPPPPPPALEGMEEELFASATAESERPVSQELQADVDAETEAAAVAVPQANGHVSPTGDGLSARPSDVDDMVNGSPDMFHGLKSASIRQLDVQSGA